MNRKMLLCLALLPLLLAGCRVSSTPVIPSDVDTTRFDGRYELLPEQSFLSLHQAVSQTGDDDERMAYESILKWNINQFSNFSIDHGIIHSGRFPVQEFSLIDGVLEGDVLRSRAYWHEDVGDPGDYVELEVELELDGDLLHFWYFESPAERGDEVVLAMLP